MKYLKLSITFYLIIFFLIFQLIHSNFHFKNSFNINPFIIKINSKDYYNNDNNNQIAYSFVCPFCEFTDNIFNYVSIDNQLLSEKEVQYENIEETSFFIHSILLDFLNNKDPPKIQYLF